MTEDYKKNLLDYMTKNLTNTQPTTNEIIKEKIEIPRTDYVFDYSPSSWQYMRIEGFIKPNEANGNIGVLYGGYTEYSGSHDPYGFIVLVDQSMKPIKYIDSFDNGTKLRYIQCMAQGDDNLFYAIDDAEMSYDNVNISNTQKRFLMLNNFLISINGEYNVILRKSYILNGAEYQNFYCKNIYKKPNSSVFVFCGDYAYTSIASASRIKAIQVNVNVGAENEWACWYVDGNYQSVANFTTFNENGEAKIQFVGIGRSGYDSYIFTKDYSGDSFVQTLMHTFTYKTGVASWWGNTQQGLYLDENNVYFVVDNQREVAVDSGGGLIPYDRYIGLYHYNISTSEFDTIYEHYLGTTTTEVNYEKIQLDKNESKLYIAYYTNFDNNTTADYYFQRYEGVWNPILVAESKPYVSSAGYDHRGFYVNNQYNLLIVALYPIQWGSNWWYFIELKEVYNQNQYNGEPYVSNNILTPLYSNLYSNGSLVFSRNRYNTTLFENTSTTSIEVPNNYLNDITITQEDLIGSTNFLLVSNLQTIQKNIYEILHINYFNTINIIDEDTNKIYKLGAIKLNQATTNGGDTNYNNAPCIKYRVNYIDNTTSIGNVSWTRIDDYNKQTYFTISANKEIKNIDLISNDENTIYLTIVGTFEIGKNYSITQKVRIGDRLVQEDLQYNGENILYNNEQVKVYI